MLTNDFYSAIIDKNSVKLIEKGDIYSFFSITKEEDADARDGRINL